MLITPMIIALITCILMTKFRIHLYLLATSLQQYNATDVRGIMKVISDLLEL